MIDHRHGFASDEDLRKLNHLIMDPSAVPVPPPPLVRADYFGGLDLGQLQDYSALCILERTSFSHGDRPTTFKARHLHRWDLGTKYPAIVQSVRDQLAKLPGARLVVDATGVGRPILDLFRAIPEMYERVIGVTITGGHGAHFDANSASWHVPKVHLVGALQAEMGRNTLKVAASLPEARTLLDELLNFRVKVSVATGNESFEAWRERDHDDLVLALAVGLWYARRAPVSGAAMGPAVLTPGRSVERKGHADDQADAEAWLEW
jgi:hypothetical protein